MTNEAPAGQLAEATGQWREEPTSNLEGDDPAVPPFENTHDASTEDDLKSWTAPDELLAAARTLNAEHVVKTGRPISRDNLRAELCIGRDRAATIIKTVRAEESRRAVTEVKHPAVA